MLVVLLFATAFLTRSISAVRSPPSRNILKAVKAVKITLENEIGEKNERLSQLENELRKRGSQTVAFNETGNEAIGFNWFAMDNPKSPKSNWKFIHHPDFGNIIAQDANIQVFDDQQPATALIQRVTAFGSGFTAAQILMRSSRVPFVPCSAGLVFDYLDPTDFKVVEVARLGPVDFKASIHHIVNGSPTTLNSTALYHNDGNANSVVILPGRWYKIAVKGNGHIRSVFIESVEVLSITLTDTYQPKDGHSGIFTKRCPAYFRGFISGPLEVLPSVISFFGSGGEEKQDFATGRT